MKSFYLAAFSEWRRLPADVLWNDTWDAWDGEALICEARCCQLGTVKQPEFNPSWDLYLPRPPQLNSIGRQLSTARGPPDPRQLLFPLGTPPLALLLWNGTCALIHRLLYANLCFHQVQKSPAQEDVLGIAFQTNVNTEKHQKKRKRFRL